ncbi:MAG: hypothetical protein KAS32_23125 [Candidatus Peribacteraceae bacterium]|nr:hypothetical protein [Candidatus Peribacteraceae bacterium]
MQKFDDYILEKEIPEKAKRGPLFEITPSFVKEEAVANALVITPQGRYGAISAITDKLRSIHLYIATGELIGYGYGPVLFDPRQWTNGRYPKITWKLQRGNPEIVMGYQIKGIDGTIWFTERFDVPDTEPMRIGRHEDKISVSIDLGLDAGR